MDKIAEAILNLGIFFLRFFTWGLKWTIATGLLFCAMGVAGYFVFLYSVQGANYVRIPNVVNLPLSNAYEEIYKSGLQIGRTEEQPSSSETANLVIAQRPPAGRVVRAGRRVDLIISVGTDLEEVPRFIGKSLREVEDLLNTNKVLVLKKPVARIPHTSNPETVIAQDPAPGKRVPRGSEISLLISIGSGLKRNIEVPNLIGLHYKKAMQNLSELGLEPVPIVVKEDIGPPNIVLTQDPQPETLVNVGERVQFRFRCTEKLENAWYEATIEYIIPQNSYPQEILIMAITRDGSKYQLFPKIGEEWPDLPPVYKGGMRITQPFIFKEQVTVEIYLDGVKVKSYFFNADAQPIVTEYQI